MGHHPCVPNTMPCQAATACDLETKGPLTFSAQVASVPIEKVASRKGGRNEGGSRFMSLKVGYVCIYIYM